VESRHAVQYFHKHNVGDRKYNLDLRERKVSLKLLSLLSLVSCLRGGILVYLTQDNTHRS
jgi:hypothetical protein